MWNNISSKPLWLLVFMHLQLVSIQLYQTSILSCSIDIPHSSSALFRLSIPTIHGPSQPHTSHIRHIYLSPSVCQLVFPSSQTFAALPVVLNHPILSYHQFLISHLIHTCYSIHTHLKHVISTTFNFILFSSHFLFII